MQRPLLNLSIAATLITAASLRADDLDMLSGKWSVKKVNDEGQNYTQTIEIKKDKYVFQILGANDRLFLYSEGDLKLEKLGPFNAARFFHVRAGNSASNLDEVNDEYVCVYVLDGDTWTLAMNLDKQRSQKPSLDVYRRVAAQASSLIIDDIQMPDHDPGRLRPLRPQPHQEQGTVRTQTGRQGSLGPRIGRQRPGEIAAVPIGARPWTIVSSQIWIQGHLTVRQRFRISGGAPGRSPVGHWCRALGTPAPFDFDTLILDREKASVPLSGLVLIGTSGWTVAGTSEKDSAVCSLRSRV